MKQTASRSVGMRLRVGWRIAGCAILTFTSATSVAQRPVKLALSVSPAPWVSGQPITITGTFSLDAVCGETGSVTFYDQGVLVGASPIQASGGVSFATYTSSLVVGAHDFTASYPGDAQCSAAVSESDLPLVVIPATVTTFSISSNPVNYDLGATLTATVTSNGVPVTEGMVCFTNNGFRFTNFIPLDANGQAQFTNFFQPGPYNFAASYANDPNFGASQSAPVSVWVQRPVTLSLSSSANPVVSGVTLTVTAAFAFDTFCGETGSVNFFDGGVLVATSPIQASNGSIDYFATYSTSALTLGSHNITATYPGDPECSAASAAAFAQDVIAGTNASVALGASKAVFRNPMTLTATVTSSLGTPAGSVTFMDGDRNLGVATLDGTGTASLPTDALNIGANGITVMYSGGGNFAPATSPVSVIYRPPKPH